MKTTYRHLGFTLVELMVVVVILAVLSTVAVTSYKRYKISARRGEGVAAVNDIRMKQETFFNTYSRYASSTEDESVFDGNMLTEPDFSGFYEWEVECPDTSVAWCNLGFEPPRHEAGGRKNLTYFQFQTMGWGAGKDAPSMIQNPDRRWVVSRARGLPGGSLRNCTDIRLSNESTDAIVLTEQKCN